MKMLPLVACGLILGVLAVCELASPAADAPAASAQPGPTAPLEVPGRTRCMLSRRGIIASAILRPVVEVLVGPRRPGDERPGADQAIRSRAAGQASGTGEGAEKHRGEGLV